MKQKIHSVICAQLVFLLLGNTLFAQTTMGNLSIANAYPRYRLSTDGQTLCIYETNDQQQRWGIFLSLTDYTWQGQGTVSLATANAALSPDFKSIYGNYDNTKGYKGDGNWIPFKKYMAWSYPDSRADRKIQWADKFFIIAPMKDGNVLAGTGLKFKDSKHRVYPITTIQAYSIVNPATGETVKPLHTYAKGQEFQIPDDFRTPSSFFIDNERLLIWTSANRYFLSLNPTTGQSLNFQTPVSILHFVGKYGMGHEIIGVGPTNIRTFRKVVIDMETGKVVQDKQTPEPSGANYWCASAGNYFYTLNGKSAVLYKEEWNGQELSLVDSIQLDMSKVVTLNKQFGLNYENYLVVSEQAGKVLLLPSYWQSGEREQESLLFWNIKDGSLAYQNLNFIRPSNAFLAKQNRPARPMTLPLNALVKNYNGYYVLLGQHQYTKKWSVIKFMRDRHGNYERVQKEEGQFEFSAASTDVVSTRHCSRCSGSGMMKTINRVTTSHTDKMIYNQITTTTTRDVAGSSTCSDCKGLGFAFGQ